MMSPRYWDDQRRSTQKICSNIIKLCLGRESTQTRQGCSYFFRIDRQQLISRMTNKYFFKYIQAKKYQDFIRVESYLTNYTVPERAAYFLSIEYKDLLSYLSTINMNIWIHLYAQKIIEERRLKAKLSKVAKDFLTTVDRPTIQQVL